MKWFALALLVFSVAAFGASRGHFGGILRVAWVGGAPEHEPALADTPAEAAALALSSQPLCRLDAQGRLIPVLAQEFQRATPTQLRLSLKPDLRFSNGRAITVRHVVDAWARLFATASPSPYRALLFPLRDGGQRLASAVTPPSLIELSQSFPFPDLDRSLCHPALAVTPGPADTGLGPFLPAPAPGVFIFNLNFPEGRPYAERLIVSRSDARGAEKAYALDQAHIILGAPPGESTRSGAALYSTYLLYNASRVGNGFRRAFEEAVDLADLVRFFVRSAPSVPMTDLLPPALMPSSNPLRTTASGPAPAGELTVLYDGALEDQRAVAERIQVKLHDRGFHVVLKALPRSLLRARWAAGDYDLMLQGVLLPPMPAPALAIALDLAGRRDLLSQELPALGAIPDAAARDQRTRERAAILRAELPMIPLYAQALSLQSRPTVQNLTFDAQGLPSFADAFLGGAP